MTGFEQGAAQDMGVPQGNSYVLGFEEVDGAQIRAVGGKGANLGELSRIPGVRVPPGFCVTTGAFRRALAQAPSIDGLLDRLGRLDPGDRDAIGEVSAEVRRAIDAVPMPDDVAAAIAAALTRLGEGVPCAVRSSATAEDLPGASFAGQHDSYLDVVGPPAVLQHVRRCWASLFTERAVTYRLRNGFDHQPVAMAVVVQRMVPAKAAGVLFTADPATGNRKVAVVEAIVGVGEALVSGQVNTDNYAVRDGAVVARTTRQAQPVLTDEQVVALVELGRRVEARLGRPQDLEWCLADDGFALVQSRPITTLFPIPEAGDDEPHVYVSVGHQQMMTDPMRPLGLSVWQLTAVPKMYEAAGRLFVDVAARLASPAARAGLIELIGRSDPLIGDALQTVADRGDVLPPAPDDAAAAAPRPPAGGPPAPIATDPAIVAELVARSRASLADLARDIGTVSGPALFAFIEADIQHMKQVVFEPRNLQVIMAGMEASWWLNDRLETWLGEKDAADVLTQSVSGNVTSEMGLALLDVADAIRPHPEVVAFLEGVEDGDPLDGLAAVAGGPQALEAIHAYLAEYGMRCVGEIDITRPRWSERPATLVPILLGNVRNFAPGEAQRHFERGLQAARAKEREVLERLRALPGGEEKADETRRMIDRVRTFSGYREHPKYHIINRHFLYKKALLAEVDRLVEAGVLREREDSFFLTFQELGEAVRRHVVDDEVIDRRRRAFASYEALTPPRVMTSDGEVVRGTYRHADPPPGALVGLPVSSGTVEGRARVVLDLADAVLDPDDILVTTFTDPSWSPLFVGIRGLVTEVGGLMTHGAVIAREYGLPAVVGVDGATTRIRDGERIRVHGSDGYVELLDRSSRS